MMAEVKIPPLSRWILLDAGFSMEDATTFEEESVTFTCVVGPFMTRVEREYGEVQKKLRRLPSQYSNGLLRVIVQWAGIDAAWRDDVAAALKLTNDQRREIERIFMRPRTNQSSSASLAPEILGTMTQAQRATWAGLTNPVCRSIELTRMMQSDDVSPVHLRELSRMAKEIEKNRTGTSVKPAP